MRYSGVLVRANVYYRSDVYDETSHDSSLNRVSSLMKPSYFGLSYVAYDYVPPLLMEWKG